MDMETTEVVICGCGPTGAMLSANLGQRGIRNVVLERELDITQDPRGIALDEDGIRLLQGLGIYESIFKEIGQSKITMKNTACEIELMLLSTEMGYFHFISGANDLHKKPFLRFNYNTVPFLQQN